MLNQSNFDFTLQTNQWQEFIQKLYLPFEGDITQKFNSFFANINYTIVNGDEVLIIQNLFFLSSKYIYRACINCFRNNSGEQYSRTISEYSYSYNKTENYFEIGVWTTQLSQFQDGTPNIFGDSDGKTNFIACN